MSDLATLSTPTLLAMKGRLTNWIVYIAAVDLLVVAVLAYLFTSRAAGAHAHVTSHCHSAVSPAGERREKRTGGTRTGRVVGTTPRPVERAVRQALAGASAPRHRFQVFSSSRPHSLRLQNSCVRYAA
jgi:hypothetical protein